MKYSDYNWVCKYTNLKLETEHDVHFGKDVLYTGCPAGGAVGKNWKLASYTQSVSLSIPYLLLYKYIINRFYQDVNKNSFM